ncbi:hypothetical protein DQ237_04925 [Blastococcus sp. TF02-8]|uniref:ABC transporter permease n=1 Tax=Blastococcus sp. TF02-8 TaxID=2250574 RepID=UPI000DE9725A|nr:ABC transporter permease [Blastococcus sp. TF02-8]RBY96952.1 hypothetical protein DQ237_04925 [Blastococcus sp. TF02-8]
MSGALPRWRPALRIARRDALRHKGRTLLVVAMVGLPVAAISGGDTLYRTADVTDAEALSSDMGQADVRLWGAGRERVYPDPVDGELYESPTQGLSSPSTGESWSLREVEAALPEGSRVVRIEEGRLGYRSDAGYADVRGFAEDSEDPMLDGRFEVVEGRLPTGDGEVAISRDVGRRGYEVGEDLALTRDEVPARIVGVVQSKPVGAPFLVLPPGDADLLYNNRDRFLATVPGGLDWPAVQELNEQGLIALSREVVVDPPGQAEWLPPGHEPWEEGLEPAVVAVLALVVASLVLEVVLLAGPAFAVGVRRQRRDLALIAVAGGSAGDLRRVVLGNGIVLGGGAAVLGAVLGVGAAAAAVPLVESRSDIVFGPFDVPVAHILGVVAVGVVAGLAASWFPARQAARTDIVDALAGRRGQLRTSWRSPVLGLVVAGAGLALVVLGARGTELAVAGGAVLLILGVVAASPWLVGLLAPLAERLPTAPRLAVRDATRNRSRTAPALAAVVATVAGMTAMAIGSSSDSARSERDYLPSVPIGAGQVGGTGAGMTESEWNSVVALLEREVPDRPMARLRGNAWTPTGNQDEFAVLAEGCTGDVVNCRWYPGNVLARHGELVVADPADLRVLGDDLVPPGVVEALDSGRAAVLGAGAVGDAGAVTVVGLEYGAGGVPAVAGTVQLPAVEVELPRPTSGPVQVAARPVVPPALAGGLPLPVETTSVVVGGPDTPVTTAEERRIDEALSLAGLSGEDGITVERGWQDDQALARLLLVLVGGALVLIATLTATGLALTDARPDFATLAAVGAAPRTRRFVAMSSAAVIGGLGAALGVLVGLAPGIAVAYPLTAEDYGSATGAAVVIPWELLGAVAIAVPLLAVVVTGLFVQSRLPMVRRIGA